MDPKLPPESVVMASSVIPSKYPRSDCQRISDTFHTALRNTISCNSTHVCLPSVVYRKFAEGKLTTP